MSSVTHTIVEMHKILGQEVEQKGKLGGFHLEGGI